MDFYLTSCFTRILARVIIIIITIDTFIITTIHQKPSKGGGKGKPEKPEKPGKPSEGKPSKGPKGLCLDEDEVRNIHNALFSLENIFSNSQAL